MQNFNCYSPENQVHTLFLNFAVHNVTMSRETLKSGTNFLKIHSLDPTVLEIICADPLSFPSHSNICVDVDSCYFLC